MKIYKTTLNKRSLIRWKVYFDRSRMYIGYIQFFLVGVLTVQSFQDQPWGKFIFKYALISLPLLFILFVLFSLVLGFLDSKLGFRQEEMRNMSRSNPIMMEMSETLQEIKDTLKKMEAEK